MKKLSIFIFILSLFLSSRASADPIFYTGGTRGGATAFNLSQIGVTTTDKSGNSVFTVLPNKNLVYAIDFRAMYEMRDDSGLRTELHCDGNAASDACGNESGVTDGWTPNLLSSGNSFYASSDNVSVGFFSLAANANVNPVNNIRFSKDIGTDFGLIDGGAYTLSFVWKHVGTGGVWKITLGQAAGSENHVISSISNSTTTFTSVSHKFIFDSTYKYLNFKEGSGSFDGGVYIDNISITSPDLAVNRGMGSPDFSGVSGWYRDPATGLLTHYAANEIPFEEHGGIIGYAAASATTNYVVESEDFTTWTTSNSGITLHGTDPAGTEKAMFLREDGTDGTHYLFKVINESIFADNAIVTFSLYAKSDTRNWLRLRLHNKDASTTTADFNLSAGEIGTTSGGSSFYIYPETTNGFYRISLTTMIGSAATNPIFYVYMGEADNDISYQGDANSGLTIFGAMVSETPSAHPYLPAEGSIEVWPGNAGALTYSLDTMETGLDGTVSGTVDSGTSLWGKQLGPELASGNPTADLLYEITADTGGDFYGGSAVGEYFVAVGTETLDADSKVKLVLNAWDSGDGLAPPHGTLIQAVRFTFDDGMQPAENRGLVSVREASNQEVSILFMGFGGNAPQTFDGSTAAFKTVAPKKDRWYWLIVEWGKLNSNVSQFRLCDLDNGLSCGDWNDYDGSYQEGDNLTYFSVGFGYVHFGPTLFYRSHLDSTFYDQLGSGG